MVSIRSNPATCPRPARSRAFGSVARGDGPTDQPPERADRESRLQNSEPLVKRHKFVTEPSSFRVTGFLGSHTEKAIQLLDAISVNFTKSKTEWEIH